MRRPRGVLLPPLAAARPRRRDVYTALRGAVLEGALAPGDRLPSSRQAAKDYGVSRGLVEEVFAQLAEEGFLARAVGRGTFVAAGAAGLATPALRARAAPLARPSPRGRALAANALCREPDRPRAFDAGTADTSEFPHKTWLRLQARAARDLGRGAMAFADPRGLPALRTAVARHLAQFRGVRCAPAQVVVFNSAQQAVHALALLLLAPRDSVWIEDPCYRGARAAFELAAARLVPVPVDDDGMRVDLALRRAPRARLAYVTPPHQYPTGAALSLERRIALLDWATRRGAWVLEDDYDGEFRYGGQPLTTLHALDASARVIYLGTLSKAMYVSLRLAYAVVPTALVEPLANVRTQLDGFTPPLAQQTMSLFMEEGHFAAHLRRMRAAYGARRAVLLDELAPLAAHGWTWSNNAAGLHVMLCHRDGASVRAVAARSPLALALLSAYRERRGKDDGLFLRFGGLDLVAIRDGARALVAALLRTGPRA